MEYQELFNYAVAIINFLIGILVKVLWDSLKTLKEADRVLTSDVAAIQILVAGDYVRREYFEKKVDAIFAKLDKIQEDVANKH